MTIPLIAIGRVVLISCLLLLPSVSQAARQADSVSTAAVAEEHLIDRISVLGTLVANESVDIRSKISEKVVRIGFQDGDLVEKGHVLVQLDDTEQQAVLRSSLAVLDERRSALKRAQQLYTRKVGSEADLDAASARVRETEADIEAIRAHIASHQIRAPFAGRLGLRTISIGALVGPEDVLTTLDDVSTVKADFNVPVAYLSQLKSGSAIKARTSAYPDREFAGTLQTVDTRVDPVTRTVVARARFENADLSLLPGMLFQARLETNPRQTLVVPEAGVYTQARQHFVFKVESSGDELVARQQQVTIGSRQTGRVEILDGLSPGDEIVVKGGLKLQDGDAIRRQESTAP